MSGIIFLPSPEKKLKTINSNRQSWRRTSIATMKLSPFLVVAAMSALAYHQRQSIGNTVVDASSSLQGSTSSETDASPNSEEVDMRINRIFSIRVSKSRELREVTDEWLEDQDISYKRISISRPEEDVVCKGAEKNDDRKRCKKIGAKTLTNLGIIDKEDTTGLTLVVEDDARIKNVALLEESLKHVPSDFDVVRWGCSGERPEEFEKVGEHVFRTACIDETRKEVECSRWFCGGTAATLLRDGPSLRKVREIWAERPYEEIDCRMTTARLKSYCVDDTIFEELEKDLAATLPLKIASRPEQIDGIEASVPRYRKVHT